MIISPDKRFVEVPQYYPSVHNSKNTLVTVLLLMLPHFGSICVMIFLLPKLLPVSGKKLNYYLFDKALPP